MGYKTICDNCEKEIEDYYYILYKSKIGERLNNPKEIICEECIKKMKQKD